MPSTRNSLLRPDPDDEIDLTNLIDPLVMICGLLMLLMPVVKGLNVRSSDLAEVGGNEVPAVAEKDRQLIEFDATGKLTWNEQPLEEEELKARLQSLPSESVVFLAGDDAAPYGTALKIRCQMQDAGIQVYELTEPSRTLKEN